MEKLPKPVVNPGRSKLDHWTRGSLYESRDIAFGRLLGLKNLGIGYSEVPPGKSGCPFHSHHVEEELFVILEGTGTYRFGETRHPVGPGDVLGAPAGGADTAHHLVNTGEVPLKYLSISTMAATEICEYPDSGKFLAKTRKEAGGPVEFRYLGRLESAVDYWEGEPGADES
ncbi:cupin domain-containing protein [Rhizobium sp. GN54]|uniref:cupin domain-containing protein n=1 Tax=Rhizobium sp. GN54 TaxID=2898150 RepID=UPI001E5C8C76|nr:cupin domain-containing protein [Rhizobium sp. GN54]MCD2181244.1 cupin domain-containing protein [Rhizobium sp. GN54]